MIGLVYIQQYIFVHESLLLYENYIKIFKTLSICSTSLKSYDIIDLLKFKPIYCEILIIVKIQAKFSFSTLAYHPYDDGYDKIWSTKYQITLILTEKPMITTCFKVII